MARLLNANKKILWQTQTVFSILFFFYFPCSYFSGCLILSGRPERCCEQARHPRWAGKRAALRNARSHLRDRATKSQGRAKTQPHHHHKKVQGAQTPTGKPCWSRWLVGGSPRELSRCHEPHRSLPPVTSSSQDAHGSHVLRYKRCIKGLDCARLASALTRLHTGTTRRHTALSEISQFPENIFSPALIKTDIESVQIWEKSKHRKISLVGRRGEHAVGVFPASEERKRPIKML